MKQKLRIFSQILSGIAFSSVLNLHAAFALEPRTSNFQILPSLGTEVSSEPALAQLLANADHRLVKAGRATDRWLDTLTYKHFFRGIEVLGSSVSIHNDGTQSQIQNGLAHFDLNTTPAFDEAQAKALTKSLVGYGFKEASVQLKILPSGNDGQAQLAYWISIEDPGPWNGREVILNAHTGDLIADMPGQESLLTPDQALRREVKNARGTPIDVFSVRGQSTLAMTFEEMKTLDTSQNGTDIPARIDGVCQAIYQEQALPIPLFWINDKECDSMINGGVPTKTADQSALRALRNAAKVYRYYLNVHERDSFDGQGSDIISIVHAHTPGASWSKQQNLLLYGDGDGKVFGDPTVGTDIAAHEITHGVMKYSGGLPMIWDLGAINEANSDFFGEMVSEDLDWVIGKGIYVDNHKHRGVRDLKNPASIKWVTKSNPHPTPFPDHISKKIQLGYRESCTQYNDWCYVHENSTIVSHARYFVTQAIGKSKAEKLYYYVMTHGLSQVKDIPDEAHATYYMCGLLYDTNTCDRVREAYGKVGL